MGVLHFRLISTIGVPTDADYRKGNDQGNGQFVITLSRQINAQNFIFRRSIVNWGNLTAPDATNAMDKGGIVVNCSFLTGYEVISNRSNSNDLMISVPLTSYLDGVSTSRFELDMDSEVINERFTVQLLKLDLSPLVTSDFGLGKNQINTVDLFFSFNELHNYNSY